METTAESELSVVMSSHLVADLERVSEYLVVLVDSRVQVAGEIDQLLASHQLLTGARRDPATLPASQHVITASHTDRQSTILVRSDEPVLDPSWSVDQIDLEDLVLAYMGRHAAGSSGRRAGTKILEEQAMIWLTWRQFRWQAITAAAVLGAVAILLGCHRATPGSAV